MQKEVMSMNRNNLQWVLFLAAVFLCVIEFEKGVIPGITLAVALLWGVSVLSCLLNFREKMFCFWLEITIGVFLIARPLFLTLEGKEWWDIDWLEQADIIRAFLIIALSLGAIYVGMNIALRKKQKINVTLCENEEKKEAFRKYLQAVSMVAFYITAAFFVISGIEKVLFCQTHSYLEYYTSFKSQLPWFIDTLGSLMKYCLCIFLATWPGKRRSFCALGLFELTALFDLYVGIRGTIVLHSVFIIVYYLLRDIKKDKEKWFGRIEQYLVAIGTPLMMVFMVAYSSIRSGLRVMDFHFWEFLKNFFISQGVTFEVVARGISVADELPQRAGRNYTFGTMIDYVVHGRIGQLLFGTEALPEGNNIINGMKSNSLAHNLSYLTRGEDYLRGQGWGSSYVLENYIDFHYVGVVLFSLILGFLLVKAMQWYGKRLLGNTIILVSLLNIFYIPRSEATGWLLFIITLQFWLCIGVCYLGACISGKVRVIGNVLENFRLLPVSGSCIKKKRSYTNIVKNKKIISALTVFLCAAVFSIYVITDYQAKNRLDGTVQCNFADGTVYEGQIVRIYAKTEGKGEDYQFQFTEVYNGREKIVQEYGEKNGYAFESSGIGIHIFYIDIQKSDGKTGTLTFQVNVRERP